MRIDNARGPSIGATSNQASYDFRHFLSRRENGYTSAGVLSNMRRCVAIIILAIGASSCLFAQEQETDVARPIKSRIAPVYPELAHKMNLGGTVKLIVTVKPDGTKKSIEVLGGNPVLVNAAEYAVSRWRWVPAPHETREIVQLRFEPQ